MGSCGVEPGFSGIIPVRSSRASQEIGSLRALLYLVPEVRTTGVLAEAAAVMLSLAPEGPHNSSHGWSEAEPMGHGEKKKDVPGGGEQRRCTDYQNRSSVSGGF